MPCTLNYPTVCPLLFSQYAKPNQERCNSAGQRYAMHAFADRTLRICGSGDGAENRYGCPTD